MTKEILIIKHIEIEGSGTIEYFFQNTLWLIRTINLAVGDTLPGSLRDIKAIITLGGPMNVYEEADYPFLRDEDIFLQNALREKVPVLGICLGAQLIAKACGAQVRKAPRKELGWHNVTLTSAGKKDSLFSGVPETLEVFQWHEDTFDIPDGAVLLAESASCIHQAFRYGENAYGFQFHIEVTPAMIGSWINEYLKQPSDAGAAKNMLPDAYKKRKAFEARANTIYANFLKIISKQK